MKRYTIGSIEWAMTASAKSWLAWWFEAAEYAIAKNYYLGENMMVELCALEHEAGMI